MKRFSDPLHNNITKGQNSTKTRNVLVGYILQCIVFELSTAAVKVDINVYYF